MSKPLSKLASTISADLIGDPATTISGICSFHEQKGGEITYLAHFKNASQLEGLKAAAIILPRDGISRADAEKLSIPVLLVESPQRSIIDLVSIFYPPLLPEPGVHPSAVVHPTASIGDGVSIGPFCVVGRDCVLGNGVVLHSHVVLYDGVILENGVTVHAGANIREYCALASGCVVQNGAVIGSDGFGYIPDKAQGIIPVPQIGTVRLGNRVDIGANSCIDRATLGSTSVSDLTKIDNLVQVGHNVRIGSGSILCAQVGIAGSCNIGSGVTLGGQTGVSDHITIADGVRTAGQTGVSEHLVDKGDYAGFPSVPVKTFWRQMAALRKLPGLIRTRRALRSASVTASPPTENE
ncbi:MAG: UDP-3-O-(3-hydroxymyristoyl)glucosamine N-acyltransferase [Bdellovibrionales bacterium]|nr:UDP-3-O-(3-hydroxymyristoyl)glucosamine N-acyltransferase [Bdellovibrionales bacterium]